MNKTKVVMNKPVYLGQAILELVKPLCMNFGMIILNQSIKKKQSYVTWILTALLFVSKLRIFTKILLKILINDYDKNDNRPLPIGINKKLIGMFMDELGGKIMIEFCALRTKTYAFLLDDNTEKKKAKGTKKCVIKREIMFEHYKDCLFNDKTIIKSQLRFKSDHDNVHTEEVNKIALSSNDDKRIPTFDKVTTYPCRTNAFKVCESEMLSLRKYI